MSETEMLDAIYWKVMAWLKPDPGVPAEETLLQIVEVYEANGREFVKVDYPAND
jgi:hypothetical protein